MTIGRATMYLPEIDKPVVGEGYATVGSNSASIHGIHQCCSAALMHNVGGWIRREEYPRPDFMTETKPVDKVRSIEAYVKRGMKMHSAFMIPYDFAYLYPLELLYKKAKTGKGGTNMYASSSYATKTWFIADRRRGETSISCMNFMLWLKSMGTANVGRIHISPYRAGAHGGDCKGGVYAPNLAGIRRVLDEGLQKLNAHAEELRVLYGLDTEVRKVTKAADEVADLW